jgi:hypothetical protein
MVPLATLLAGTLRIPSGGYFILLTVANDAWSASLHGKVNAAPSSVYRVGECILITLYASFAIATREETPIHPLSIDNPVAPAIKEMVVEYSSEVLTDIFLDPIASFPFSVIPRQSSCLSGSNTSFWRKNGAWLGAKLLIVDEVNVIYYKKCSGSPFRRIKFRICYFVYQAFACSLF